jgi:hypothetical protein
MTDFDQILEQCLNDLASGASTLEECLARHPEHAAQLKPLLLAAARLGAGSTVTPAPAFKARARAQLTRHMQERPHRKARSGFAFRQLAAGFAAILLALLVTGTVYAQGALPGDSLYGWKLASEHAWRIFSSDTVNTDLEIANRRITEMNVTVDDPLRRAQALEGYQEVRTRLESEMDAETLKSILPPVDAFDYPQPFTTPTPTTGETATPFTEDPEIVGTSVPANHPTKGPGTHPTKPPKIIPTIKIPPPLR